MNMTDPRPEGAVVLREGAIEEFAGIVDRLAAKRIFFVVDEAAYRAGGAAESLESVLMRSEVVRFNRFALNPKAEDVERGVALWRDFRPDLTVALGGGTALDLGKLIGVFAAQTASIRELITGAVGISRPSPPLVAIPTTAGTGSEATHFAVVYLDGEKYSAAHPSLLPAWALVDPRLTYSLPARITAATGLDAFCQAVESLWAVGATQESVADASRALQSAWTCLPCAVNEPTPQARLKMCEAAHYAGRAINVGKTTAPHALSYRITSKYGLPHGVAVAMTLSPLLAYNAQVTADDCQDPRGVEYVRRQIARILELLGATDVADGCRRIEAFIAAVACPPSLAAAGIVAAEDLHEIVRSVNAERMSNNPRRLNPLELESLLKTTV